MSRLIHKKWLPLEGIEVRYLKFCMGPYFPHTHAVQKERLNLRTFWKIGPAYSTFMFWYQSYHSMAANADYRRSWQKHLKSFSISLISVLFLMLKIKMSVCFSIYKDCWKFCYVYLILLLTLTNASILLFCLWLITLTWFATIF